KPACRIQPLRRDLSRQWRGDVVWPWRPPAGGVSLFGSLFGRDRQRLRPGPTVLGDVEEDTLRPVELFLAISGLVAALALVDIVLGAEALEFLRERVDILDQYAEVVNAAVIHALAELIGFEFQDRHVERAVTQEHAVREHPVWPPNLLE